MDQAQTVTRAFAVLELLSKHHALSAAGVNKELGYHRSTTYRLLGTLKQLNYIRKDEKTGLYSLSPKILTLASTVTEQRSLTETARPFLEDLQECNRETVHLAILDNDELVYLDKIESSRGLRVVMGSRTGNRAPLYCTGIGKVLLSSLSEKELNHYISLTELKRFTTSTITETDALIAEIDSVKRKGYALDREEHEIGVFCVAAPVKNPHGRTMASLSVSMPSVRRTDELQEQLIIDVLSTAEKISTALFRQ